MTLTINLKPDLESQLRDEAARSGMEPDAYMVQALEQRLHQSQPDPCRLSPAESKLLIKINRGPAGVDWDDYHALVARNRDGTITLEEHEELIAMIHIVENANAERIKNLIALARLRGISLDSLLESLKISTPAVE